MWVTKTGMYFQSILIRAEGPFMHLYYFVLYVKVQKIDFL
jgi:hypothetical protein